MKALCVKQPWAWMLVADGNPPKTIETRTWQTNYRGELVIVASKKFDKNFENAFYRGSRFIFCAGDLVYGKTVGIVTLTDCRPMTEADQGPACCGIYPGAFAWVMEKPTPLPAHPVRGQLQLFEVLVCRRCMWVGRKENANIHAEHGSSILYGCPECGSTL